MFLIEKLFPIFLIFQFFHKVDSSVFFNYPYYLTLSNDNIFLIHYKGIDIYDSSFNKINQIIQFSGDEEMTEEIFAKIIIKYDNVYILSIINDKIYIFNNEGKFLYKSEDKINNAQTIKSYALTSIGLYNGTYKYAIGFFDDLINLNLLLYSYNIDENSNTLLSITKDNKYYIQKDDEWRIFTQKNNNLSCEYMYKNNSDINENSNIFTCFFFGSDNITTTNYIISDNKLVHFPNISSIFSRNINEEDNTGQTFIKSEINYNRTLAFIWFHFSGIHKTYFTIFNISSNKMQVPSWVNNCSSETYKTKINKFPKSNELSITYEINDKIIKANLFNNIDNYNNNNRFYFELNTSCENIEGPAISYYNNNQNYYIYYCFKNCSDELYKNDSYCLNVVIIQSSNNITIYIIIAVIVIILFVISIFIYKRYLRRKEEQNLTKDENLINDISKEALRSIN